MSSRFCHHVHENGGFCQSPPVQKRNYCYFHLEQLGRRMQMARARAKGERVPFTLPLLEDLYSVQVGLIQLADAITAGDIEPKRAQILLSVLRLAASNLKGQGWTPFRRFLVDENTSFALLDNPGFEDTFKLPKRFDLSQQPEVAFPPPNPAAGATPLSPAVGDMAAAATALSKPGGSDPDSPEQRLRRRALELVAQGRTAQVTPFDVELMEIYEKEGEAAMIERVKRHTADERRAEQRRRTRANRERFDAEARVRNAANLATQLLSEQQSAAGRSATNSQTPSVATATQSANSATGKKPPQPELLAGAGTKPDPLAVGGTTATGEA